MDTLILILMILSVALLIGLLILGSSLSRDGVKIKDHIETEGGLILQYTMDFGPLCWFRIKGPRNYLVRYRDKQGRIHNAVGNISAAQGLRFIEDSLEAKDNLKVVFKAPSSAGDAPLDAEALKAENDRLRDEMSRLRQPGH